MKSNAKMRKLASLVIAVAMLLACVGPMQIVLAGADATLTALTYQVVGGPNASINRTDTPVTGFEAGQESTGYNVALPSGGTVVMVTATAVEGATVAYSQPEGYYNVSSGSVTATITVTGPSTTNTYTISFTGGTVILEGLNVVSNPGFDGGWYAWNPQDGLPADGTQTSQNLKIESGMARIGKGNGTPSGSNCRAILEQYIPVLPNTDYTFKYYNNKPSLTAVEKPSVRVKTPIRPDLYAANIGGTDLFAQVYTNNAAAVGTETYTFNTGDNTVVRILLNSGQNHNNWKLDNFEAYSEPPETTRLDTLKYQIDSGSLIDVPGFNTADEGNTYTIPGLIPNAVSSLTFVGVPVFAEAVVSYNPAGGVVSMAGITPGVETQMVVTSEWADHSDALTFTIKFTRAEAEDDARLSALKYQFDSAAAIDVPGFDTADEGNTYGPITVPYEIADLTVSATKSGTYSTLEMDPVGGVVSMAGVEPGVPFDATVEVTAEDGTVNIFTVNFERAEPSHDATLSALTYQANGAPAAKTVDGFEPTDGTETYNVELPFGSTSATVVAAKNESHAQMVMTPSDGVVTMVDGAGQAVVQVTAQDGTVNTYTINFTVALPDDNAKLYSLKYQVGTDPAKTVTGFVSADEEGTYNVKLLEGTTSVTVTAVAEEPLAQVTISNGGVIPIVEGEGTATVTVISTDTSNTNTYTINFTNILKAVEYAWNFNVDTGGNVNVVDGWRRYTSLDDGSYLAGNGAYLKSQYKAAGTKAGIVSDESTVPLNKDLSLYKKIRILLQNATTSTTARIWWSTTTEGHDTFNVNKMVDFALVPSDTGFTEYVIDMSDQPLWTGTLRQLRIDSSTDGLVRPNQILWFDYIKLYGEVELNGNASLASLSYNADLGNKFAVPGWQATDTNATYAVALPPYATSGTVAAPVADPGATVVMNPANGVATLVGGTGTVTVDVTSSDGKVTNHYTVNFTAGNPAYNMIQNPSFETGDFTSWTTIAGQYTYNEVTKDGSVQIATDQFYLGANSACLIGYHEAGTNPLVSTWTTLQQTVAVDPNEDYVWSFYGKSNTVGAGFYVNNADNTQIANGGTSASTNNWKLYTIPFNSGNTNEVKLLVKVGWSGTHYIDGFDLRPVVRKATLSGVTASYNKSDAAPAAVEATITYNDASAVTDVKVDGNSVGETNYSVALNTLSVSEQVMNLLSLGNHKVTVEFDKGRAAEFTISVSQTIAPVDNKAELIVLTGNGGSVYLNSEATPFLPYYKNTHDVGEVVKLTAVPNSPDYVFAYWQDTNLYRVISVNPVYEFTIGSSRAVNAVFFKAEAPTDTQFAVAFKDKSGKVLKSTSVDKNTAAVAPPSPVLSGYDFVSWDKDFSSVVTNMVINAVYQRKAQTYSLNVTGGTLSTGGTVGSYKYDMPVTVIVGTAPEGQKFSHWLQDGTIKISTHSTYSFFMPMQNTTLEAVFVDDETVLDDAPFITMSEVVVVDTVNKTMLFGANRTMTAGYTLIESGILVKSGVMDPTSLTVDTPGVLFGRAENNTTDWFYVRKSKIASGSTWNARAYLIYKDGAGNVFTVYSANAVSRTMD